MVTIRKMVERDADFVLIWNEKTEPFLKQWSNFIFPLTREQIIERINSDHYIVFSIEEDGILIGTVQLFKFNQEERSARVGCYLINPNARGKGIGSAALNEVVAYAFNTMKLDKLSLAVFDYNTSAIKCYEKCGFVRTGDYINPMGWLGYNMEIHKN